MSKVRITLWDRDFELPVSYSCYPGEQVTVQQKETLALFCKSESPADGALPELKKYVIKTSEGQCGENIENIFKYVIPKSLYIPRADGNIVAIICSYKFDMENGIAVVFENGKLKKIGTQDVIL